MKSGKNKTSQVVKKKDAVKIENRIKKMSNILEHLESIIDKLPDSFPETVKDLIKKPILGNKELKQIMEQLEHNRPPRIFVIGRTGMGKSSLINALCGGYVAEVGDVESETTETKKYSCNDGGRKLMDIMDSRGIAENTPVDEQKSAEEQLMEDLIKFNPDVALLVFNCVERSESINQDLKFMDAVRKKYYGVYGSELQVVVALNKADEAPPSREKQNYSARKLDIIQSHKMRYQREIAKQGLKVREIVPVSSVIDWQTPYGEEVTTEEIRVMPLQDVENLEIFFDGRYNMDALREALENAIGDYEAKMGLRMAFKQEELVINLAKQINKIMSGVAATVAATPIPVSDVYILMGIQAVDIVLIAALGGEEVSLEGAKKFIISLSGIGAVGIILRIFAQQAVKLANGLFPGVGSTISAGIAAGGTMSMGKAAISYYIKGIDLKKAKEIFKKEKSEDID